MGQSSYRDILLENFQARNPTIWPRREVSDACMGVRAAMLAENERANLDNHRPWVWTLTFLQEAGCHILPNVRIMMEISNRFGTQWHRIVFGGAALAERELDQIGMAHFFVDLGELDVTRKAGQSTNMFGCLAYSPLMDPAFLDARFRVAWNEGDAYLLVLASKAKETERPLPRNFAQQFENKRSAVQPGLGNMRGMCARLAGYFRRFGEKWPVSTDPSLPPLKGWQ